MENLIKRATIMADGNQITAADLGLDTGQAKPPPFNLRHARENASAWPSAARSPTATAASPRPPSCSASRAHAV